MTTVKYEDVYELLHAKSDCVVEDDGESFTIYLAPFLIGVVITVSPDFLGLCNLKEPWTGDTTRDLGNTFCRNQMRQFVEQLVHLAVNIEGGYQRSSVLKLNLQFRQVDREVDFLENVNDSIICDNNWLGSVVALGVVSLTRVVHALEDVQEETTESCELRKFLTDIRWGGHADFGHAKALSASYLGVMGLDGLKSMLAWQGLNLSRFLRQNVLVHISSVGCVELVNWVRLKIFTEGGLEDCVF